MTFSIDETDRRASRARSSPSELPTRSGDEIVTSDHVEIAEDRLALRQVRSDIRFSFGFASVPYRDDTRAGAFPSILSEPLPPKRAIEFPSGHIEFLTPAGG